MDIFQTSLQDQTLLVRLSGELDLNIADRLRISLDEELAKTRANNLLLDLSEVNFIDSSALGVFLGRYRRLSDAGGRVMLAGAKPHVRKILEISGLLRIMKEYSSTGEALAKIG